MAFKLKEAYSLPHNKGKVKMRLAEKLWPNSAPKTQMQSIIKLLNGTYKTINFEFVGIICKELQVDANYLFGVRKPRRK
jgi:hypothetical protein